MNTKLFAALACIAALALGACSGGGAPAAPTTPAPTDPGTDTRTEAQKTFDTSLTNAQTALTAARAAVTSAVALAAAADTAAERTAATTALSNARTGLTRAVATIAALAAPTGDTTRRGQLVAAVNAANAAKTADEAKLAAEETKLRAAGNTGTWYGGAAYIPSYRAPAPALTVVRRARNADASTDHDDVLDAQSFPVIQYAAGKYVISQGQATGGEWLRMRGFEVSKASSASGWSTHVSRHSDHQMINDRDNSSVLIAGMKLAPTGLMMQLGGKSTADLDFLKNGAATATRRDGADSAPATTARLTSGVDALSWDLTLTFGLPGGSPDGNGEYYWTAPLYKDATQRSQDWAGPTDGGTLAGTHANRHKLFSQLGTYQIWLTNLVSSDFGREPTAGTGTHPGDDKFSFLKYAAYGMMTLAPVQNLNPAVSGRIHAFYVGYDAFKDEAGKQADDIGSANKITDAKFVGRTIGFTTPSQEVAGTPVAFPIDVDGARRLRGDVELTVTISDTAQRITDGSIKNLEYWDGITGAWATFTAVPSGIDIGADNIEPNGTFNPQIRVRNAADTETSPEFDRNGYLHGNFLGPHDGLEAAGWWHVRAGGGGTASGRSDITDGTTLTPTEFGLIGSFGAKREEPATPASGS